MGCVAGGGAGLREADLDLEAAVGSRLKDAGIEPGKPDMLEIHNIIKR
jgi:hypothetical protein